MNNISSIQQSYLDLKKSRKIETIENNYISESWIRCLEKGYDHSKIPESKVMSQQNLNRARDENQNVRKFVLPELELLFSQIAGTNFMVAYADQHGTVLDTIYDTEFSENSAKKVVIPGSSWTEELKGTNGLGLAVKTKKASIVEGKEHFFDTCCELSCFASPIFDHKGNVLGVIDASSDARSREQHTLALVKLASRSVETRIFVEQFKSNMIIGFHPRKEYLSTTSMGLIALNEDGFISGVNVTGKMMLHGINFDDELTFSKVFSSSFGTIIKKLKTNDLVQITDWMGSTVFAYKYQNGFKRNFLSENVSSLEQKDFTPCKSCSESLIKSKTCIMIKTKFDENNNNYSKTARELGISRTTIYKHLENLS